MSHTKVTRNNLKECVDAALTHCRDKFDSARALPDQAQLVYELDIAQQALNLIKRELDDPSIRRPGKLSARFTRYVIDEEPIMLMDSELREWIVKIEDVYARHWGRAKNLE